MRSWDFGESDKIVSFFTESHGKVTGIAKGAKRSRRRFVNTLEPFSLVNLRFQDRPNHSLAFIHACDLIRVFKHLLSSLDKITHASYLVEITDELTREREINPALFDHLREGLTYVEERGASLSFLTFYEMRLLKLSGYEPMLERCRRCGARWESAPGSRWCFSLRDGGVVCQGCSSYKKETLPLSQETIRALGDLQQGKSLPSIPLSISILKEARSLLPRFIQYQISKELKSVRFVEMFS